MDDFFKPTKPEVKTPSPLAANDERARSPRVQRRLDHLLGHTCAPSNCTSPTPSARPFRVQFQFEGRREPIEQALANGRDAWWRLAQLLPAVAQATGAAWAHEPSLRGEAAFRMIENHEAVLRDVCNPSKTHNIIGIPLRQAELTRVPMEGASYASACMREVCRRLIGDKPGTEECKEQLDGSPDCSKCWVATCAYLMCRIQAHKDEMPGRTPDFSYNSTFSIRAVLQEVALHAMGMGP